MDALSIVMRLGGGRLLEDFADALQRVSDEVAASGQDGSVTVKVAVKMMGRHGDRRVATEPEIGIGWPKNKMIPMDFFSVDGVLSHDDPRQTRMGFEAVETRPAASRDAETAPVAAREA